MTIHSQPPIYPSRISSWPTDIVDTKKYTIRFAANMEDLDAIQKLRYEIFNLELHEGFTESDVTKRDVDEYDIGCHHLMVTEKKTGNVIGTYRMQTREMAKAHLGFYSAKEFEFDDLPETLRDEAVELGRACIAKEHRNGKVLFLLWRGISMYLLQNNKRYFFGCCSLGSQDPAEGWQLLYHMRDHGYVHPDFCIDAKPEFKCEVETVDMDERTVVQIPQLAQLYLNYGAKICSYPALDRKFKTIDYLTVFDMSKANPRDTKRFIGRVI